MYTVVRFNSIPGYDTGDILDKTVLGCCTFEVLNEEYRRRYGHDMEAKPNEIIYLNEKGTKVAIPQNVPPYEPQ